MQESIDNDILEILSDNELQEVYYASCKELSDEEILNHKNFEAVMDKFNNI